MKPLVYIAGPYTNPDPVTNTRRAIFAGRRLYDTGLAAVIIPHLSMHMHFIDPAPIEYWYQYDLDQLDHCDALYRLPGESSGADKEVDYALQLSIPTFFADEREDWSLMLGHLRELAEDMQ